MAYLPSFSDIEGVFKELHSNRNRACKTCPIRESCILSKYFGG